MLEVDRLQTHFRTRRGVVRAVDGMSFTIERGETIALVGESGFGKSVTAMSIMRLLQDPPARSAGAIRLDGKDILALPEKEMRKLRGGDVAMIFQEPMTCLNPVMTVGAQIAETLRVHRKVGRAEARDEAVAMLRLVGLPDPERRARAYPHELSGGMRQRVMIAIAIVCSPKLLIADEPTTALDVTVQAQMLDLLRALQRRIGAAILLITHDLGVAAAMADRVVVMYAGRAIEEAPIRQLLAAPRHPYTRALIASATRRATDVERRADAPDAAAVTAGALEGCAFAPRCPDAVDICVSVMPAIEAKAPGHLAACHIAAKDAGAAP